jgi:hypothetical protein
VDAQGVIGKSPALEIVRVRLRHAARTAGHVHDAGNGARWRMTIFRSHECIVDGQERRRADGLGREGVLYPRVRGP